VSFCGHELKVDARALVPRPETERVAELAWERLAKAAGESPAVLDFGTGSGCLAIELALRCPSAEVHALDLSSEALALARENASAQGVGDRIQFHAGDGFGAVPPGLCFDMVVANPPYIPTGEIGGLEPEVRDHDPRMALDGGADGLAVSRRIAADGLARMRRGGVLLLEFGDGQAPALEAIFLAENWVVESVVADYSGRPRILVAVAPGT
jgi:release factor glutamine methyltransferase